MRALNLAVTTIIVSALLLVTARAEPVKIGIGWIVPVTDAALASYIRANA